MEIEKLVNTVLDARALHSIPTIIKEEKLTKVQGQKLIKNIASRLQAWTIHHFRKYQISWYAKKITQLSHIAESLGYRELSKALIRKYRDSWIKEGLWRKREELSKEKEAKPKKTKPSKASKEELLEIYETIKAMIQKLGGSIDELS